jgi:G2/mitotic-specific cyclin 1/2
VTKKRTSGTRAKSTLVTTNSNGATTTAATAIAAAAKLNALNEKKVNVNKQTSTTIAPGIKNNVPRVQPTAKSAETKQKPATATTTTTTITTEEKATLKSTVVQEKKEVVVVEEKVTVESVSTVTKSESETKTSDQTKSGTKEVLPPWAALDAEDADDPLMVAEYADDIFQYMLELEVSSSNGYYFISIAMNRSVLIMHTYIY